LVVGEISGYKTCPAPTDKTGRMTEKERNAKLAILICNRCLIR